MPEKVWSAATLRLNGTQKTSTYLISASQTQPQQAKKMNQDSIFTFQPMSIHHHPTQKLVCKNTSTLMCHSKLLWHGLMTRKINLPSNKENNKKSSTLKKKTVTKYPLAFLTYKSCKRKSKSQDHLIKWLLLVVGHHSDKFSDNRHYDKWDLMFLICHITYFYDLFKYSWDFMVGIQQPKSPRCLIWWLQALRKWR